MPRPSRRTTPSSDGPNGRPPTARLRAAALSTSVLLATLALGAAAPPGRGTAADRPPLFTDEAAATGLDFVHFNGMSGEYYFPEMTGPGGALLDYDNDGDLDVYLPQGHMMGPGKTLADATFPPRHPLPLTDRLYRNDLTIAPDGSRRLRFTDVTEAAGIDGRGYGMGVATGDYDNDGWTDLYVTNFGSNQLLHNNGDGTFSDVTAASGTDDARWSIAAAFVDYDDDGWLDLFVGNYVDFSYVVHKVCTRSTGARDYCGPLAYDPQPNRLFHNRGDGTFEDVSVKSGIQSVPGTTLGVVTADFDGDGRIDIYVANDMQANQLWLNQGDGTFRDDALLAGCALNSEGQAEASMGVDAGDFDGDGDEDLFMAHLRGETNTLYINDGSGIFEDRTLSLGLGNPSWNFTGFGTGWFDYDNDGWLDLVAVNGAVKTLEALALEKDPYPLHQTNQLFHNRGGLEFEEVTATAGPVFRLSEVSRGTAFGDIDNDGDTDLLVVNNAGPVRLLVNRAGQERPSISLRLLTGDPPRDALGSRAGVVTDDGRTLWRRVRSEGSYASANDPRIQIGLGAGGPRRLRIRWWDGKRAEWLAPPSGRYLTFLRRGTR